MYNIDIYSKSTGWYHFYVIYHVLPASCSSVGTEVDSVLEAVNCWDTDAVIGLEGGSIRPCE